MTVERFTPAGVVESVPDSVRAELAAVLDDVEAFAKRFLATLTDDHFAVLAAWIVHTYLVVEHGYATVYLHVTSAERSSGKTRLLEILNLLCFRSSGITLNPSSASLFRELDTGAVVTFLLDEVDNFLKGGNVESEARRDVLSILNGGYLRGATVARTLGAGTKGETVKRYDVFGPKALAGIGELPPTLASRSLRLALKKRTSSEPVERLRLRHVEPQAEKLRGRLEAVAAEPALGAYVAAAELELVELEDRLVDAVELMVAIADVAGDEWGRRIRRAVVSVAAGTAEAVTEGSLGVQLLADLQTITARKPRATGFPSELLLDDLNTLEESPWGGFNDGAGVRARDLSRRLRPYGCHSLTLRLDEESRTRLAAKRSGGKVGETARGYKLDELAEAFARYVPKDAEAGSSAHDPTQPTQPNAHAGLRAVGDPTQADPVSDPRSAANPHGDSVVSDVSEETAETRPGEVLDARSGRDVEAESTEEMAGE